MESSTSATDSFLSGLGFEQATTSSIPKILSKTKFEPGTAVRDAIVQGIALILKVNTELLRYGTAHYWNFMNIVITDGDDNSSSHSKNELKKIFQQVNYSIPSERCKTVLVGVGLGRSARKEFNEYSDVGGQNCQFIEGDSAEIEEIFQRIQVDFAIWRETNVVAAVSSKKVCVTAESKISAMMSISRRRFAVIFTLDISPSMEERTGWFTFNTKWKSLKKAVNKFLSTMNSDDLVCCILFNEKVRIMTQKKEKGWCQIF